MSDETLDHLLNRSALDPLIASAWQTLIPSLSAQAQTDLKRILVELNTEVRRSDAEWQEQIHQLLRAEIRRQAIERIALKAADNN